MANVFLSYASADRLLIQHFASELTQLGYTVWWDREIPIGSNYSDEIERQIKEADCIIVLWTRQSIQSQWVKNEATIANRLQKLVPVMLEQVEIPLAFMHIETALLTEENKEHHDNEMNLLRMAIQRCMEKKGDYIIPPPPPPPPPPPIERLLQKRWLVMALALVSFVFMLFFLLKPKTSNSSTITVHGRVKTSDEKPIANVELNVEGTIYFCKSQTDGSYQLQIQDVKPNEMIEITTSREGFADKTISINSSDGLNLEKDIYLSPIE